MLMSVMGSKRLDICVTVVFMTRSHGLIIVSEKEISEERHTIPQCLVQTESLAINCVLSMDCNSGLEAWDSWIQTISNELDLKYRINDFLIFMFDVLIKPLQLMVPI
jgi:hypothetical protein